MSRAIVAAKKKEKVVSLIADTGMYQASHKMYLANYLLRYLVENRPPNPYFVILYCVSNQSNLALREIFTVETKFQVFSEKYRCVFVFILQDIHTYLLLLVDM